MNNFARLAVHLMRTIIGGLIGLVLSALLGAVLFGLWTYIIGKPTFGWVVLVAFWGSMFCSIGGLVLGLVVGVVDCKRLAGALLGGAMPFMFVVYSLFAGTVVGSRSAASLFALAFVGMGALVGVLTVILTSTATSWLRLNRH